MLTYSQGLHFAVQRISNKAYWVTAKPNTNTCSSLNCVIYKSFTYRDTTSAAKAATIFLE